MEKDNGGVINTMKYSNVGRGNNKDNYGRVS